MTSLAPELLKGGDVAGYLKGATVAVVGNASSGLERSLGRAVDACDIVIRLNAGVPDGKHYAAIGERTDVLSVANLQTFRESWKRLLESPAMLWFVKPTRFGEKQWGKVLSGHVKGSPWWRYPLTEIETLRWTIGSPPGCGACTVHMAALHASEVHVFGFDFFAGPTWWHSQRPRAAISRVGGPTHNHDGAKERAWLTEHLGAVEREVGWWVIGGE